MDLVVFLKILQAALIAIAGGVFKKVLDDHWPAIKEYAKTRWIDWLFNLSWLGSVVTWWFAPSLFHGPRPATMQDISNALILVGIAMVFTFSFLGIALIQIAMAARASIKEIIATLAVMGGVTTTSAPGDQSSQTSSG